MKLAIIPARSGSKRIKNKNILDFFGKPLIYYPLKAAKESKLFDEIHVSTDSEEIKNIVEKLGFEVNFLRDKKLADDYTGLFSVIKWVFEEYKERGKYFDEIFCIMPAAPLLSEADLINGYKKFKKFNSVYPLIVASPFSVPIEWAFYRDNDGILVPKDKISLQKRSQDIETTFYESGPFNIFSSRHLEDNEFFIKSKYISILMDKTRAIDIDNYEDLEYAKVLYLGNKQLKDN
ncbi:MAG: pseudaminic acid cytidylyltransferase [Pelagibacterales bacterium]|nr:pseudaminic acid cytidylyltransferase [Pelagibacterales bacterium]|tara:strand:- start:25412 stop:26113 length:702 start_codon:yes stop_codon:yes gene_type:complete